MSLPPQLERFDIAATQARLRNVYWIGGGSGAGKSTIAERLCANHDLQLYSTDDVMRDHVRRSTPEETPLLRAFGKMTMDERWVNRSPSTMLRTFHWFSGEGFPLIVEDLLARAGDLGIVVEGFRLLPTLVRPLLTQPNRAVWLLPTPEFRMKAFTCRGTSLSIPNRTTRPERALSNLLARDRMFTERLLRDCRAAGLPYLSVDTSITEDELYDRVLTMFELSGHPRKP